MEVVERFLLREEILIMSISHVSHSTRRFSAGASRRRIRHCMATVLELGITFELLMAVESPRSGRMMMSRCCSSCMWCFDVVDLDAESVSYTKYTCEENHQVFRLIF